MHIPYVASQTNWESFDGLIHSWFEEWPDFQLLLPIFFFSVLMFVWHVNWSLWVNGKVFKIFCWLKVFSSICLNYSFNVVVENWLKCKPNIGKSKSDRVYPDSKISENRVSCILIPSTSLMVPIKFKLSNDQYCNWFQNYLSHFPLTTSALCKIKIYDVFRYFFIEDSTSILNLLISFWKIILSEFFNQL